MSTLSEQMLQRRRPAPSPIDNRSKLLSTAKKMVYEIMHAGYIIIIIVVIIIAQKLQKNTRTKYN